MTWKVFEEGSAFDGSAIRRQIAVFPGGEGGPRIDLLLYLPHSATPAPAVLGLNFWSNSTVISDPAVRSTQAFVEDPPGRSRGSDAHRWPIEKILARGYAFATMFREEVAPDQESSLTGGVLGLYPGYQERADNFATIAAWAWGLSRAMDVLSLQPEVDSERVAVFGWSRLGKAALWAAANDARFALAISNQSGAGGACLMRHGQGETIADLNRAFPHWFARNFRKYNGRDRELPFDAHWTIAAIAPRPVYAGSAIEDRWADPEGEFLSLLEATPVYRALGLEGLPVNRWPEVGSSVQGTLGYHVRAGGHDVTDEDWHHYLDFMDRHLKGNRPQGLE